MARLKRKLKGTTLVETLAASIIVAISFGIGTMIYFNILFSSKSLSKELAETACQDWMNTSIHFREFQNKTIDKEDFSLSKEITTYNGRDLYLISISASQNQTKLSELKRIVFIK